MRKCPQTRAYDTLKGVIYSLQTSDYVRSILERELDMLYESWLKLADESGPAPSAQRRQQTDVP